MSAVSKEKSVAVIGAGPSGLCAANYLARLGYRVTVFERKSSPARKFLMAGRGGLNLTHSESLESFIPRYRGSSSWMADAIHAFGPEDLKNWCQSLGQEVFTGTSGRIFPKSMKASPLLRAWLSRLNELGVELRLQHDWKGWNEDGDLIFSLPSGETVLFRANATLLALGGASWPGLGSDGAWAGILGTCHIPLSPFRPSNCGFEVLWSETFKQKCAGQPVKNIRLSLGEESALGEMMITERGIEGGAVYALSAPLRDAIEEKGQAILYVDLRPSLDVQPLREKLERSDHGRKSLSTRLKSVIGLTPVQTGLLYEADRNLSSRNAHTIASMIKAVPLHCLNPFPLDRAISSAGGVNIAAIDDTMMLESLPGVFVAGEMIDWEAPTGGYLLQGCFSTAVKAARGIDRFLKSAA